MFAKNKHQQLNLSNKLVKPLNNLRDVKEQERSAITRNNVQ